MREKTRKIEHRKILEKRLSAMNLYNKKILLKLMINIHTSNWRAYFFTLLGYDGMIYWIFFRQF